MQDQLKKRVAELETEYRTGQEMLAELDAKRADLHQTLLRISGAIQVLQELLGTDHDSADNGTRSAQPSTLPPPQDSAVPSPSLVAG